MQTSAALHSPVFVDARRLSGPKLAIFGVRLLNRYDLLLQCGVCGETWTPTLLSDGRLPRGYWQCPNKCNW